MRQRSSTGSLRKGKVLKGATCRSSHLSGAVDDLILDDSVVSDFVDPFVRDCTSPLVPSIPYTASRNPQHPPYLLDLYSC